MNRHHILIFLKVAAYVAMIGYAIEAGTIIITFVVSLFNPEAAGYFINKRSLAAIASENSYQYYSAASFLLAMPVIQSSLWLAVIQLFPHLNLENPFQEGLISSLNKLLRPLLAYGIVGFISEAYFDWLNKRYDTSLGSQFSLSQYLFILGVIVVVSEIIKRGIALKEENEFTV